MLIGDNCAKLPVTHAWHIFEGNAKFQLAVTFVSGYDAYSMFEGNKIVLF